MVVTSENMEPVVPDFPELERFDGRVIHTCAYKSGVDFEGEKVLVVGCGNSSMEVSLDLCLHGTQPHMVSRINSFFSINGVYSCSGACVAAGDSGAADVWSDHGAATMATSAAGGLAPVCCGPGPSHARQH
ncbi:hypothetical protein Cni_G01445 [Canna indica]|uniref:Flavin-containing monooxygenase n=1 Tax=Canna indica TaxID=4628 RepID=A0AAQ3Q118_9LILI|nr:hypothetical protein Cni_G01445 [Canna indica]